MPRVACTRARLGLCYGPCQADYALSDYVPKLRRPCFPQGRLGLGAGSAEGKQLRRSLPHSARPGRLGELGAGCATRGAQAEGQVSGRQGSISSRGAPGSGTLTVAPSPSPLPTSPSLPVFGQRPATTAAATVAAAAVAAVGKRRCGQGAAEELGPAASQSGAYPGAAQALLAATGRAVQGRESPPTGANWCKSLPDWWVEMKSTVGSSQKISLVPAAGQQHAVIPAKKVHCSIPTWGGSASQGQGQGEPRPEHPAG